RTGHAPAPTQKALPTSDSTAPHEPQCSPTAAQIGGGPWPLSRRLAAVGSLDLQLPSGPSKRATFSFRLNRGKLGAARRSDPNRPRSLPYCLAGGLLTRKR